MYISRCSQELALNTSIAANAEVSASVLELNVRSPETKRTGF